MTIFSAPGRMPAGRAARFGRAARTSGQLTQPGGATAVALAVRGALVAVRAPVLVTANAAPAVTAPAATTTATTAKARR
jgi:hypothetical protein